MKPVSLFIMDVSNSSAAGEELSSYLMEVEGWIKDWFAGKVDIQVKHRAGDEIIFIGQGFSTAYIAAFFISRLWKYRTHMPYFGLAHGTVEQNVVEIDLEKWIHPLVKLARMASDTLKKEQKQRGTLFFASGEGNKEIGMLLNRIEKLKHALESQQTDIQWLVCSLYLIYQKQNAVAGLLDKSAPTIYSHFKKGHSELILESFEDIRKVLDSIQAREFEMNKELDGSQLEQHIREKVKRKIEKDFTV